MMKKLSLIIAGMLFLFASGVNAQRYSYADSWGKAGFNLVDSKANAVQVIFSVPQFSLEDFDLNGQTVKDVSLPGALLFNDAGAPNLPGQGSYIAVPQGSTPKMTIVSQRTETIHGVDIVPAPVIPWDNDKTPMVYEKKQSIYTNNAFYPESPVKVSEVTQIRGVDAVLLGITPFQYNPVTRDLIVYKDIKVEITFEGGNGQFGDDRLRSRWFDPILQDAILNRDALPEIDYGKRTAALAGKKDVGFEYLIIVPNNPEFSQWADSIKAWRTSQGILTGIKTLTEVGGNTSTAIKNYVTNAYNTWDVPPVAVLLMADYGSNIANTITSPMWDNYCISDNFYADVNNNMMPDIVFSRITANNADQLQVMVGKGINYERTPPTNPDFYQHPITALGWQTERWFQICSEVVGGFWHNTMGKDQVRINAIYQGNPNSDPWSTATNTSQVVNYFGPNGLGYIPSTPQQLGGFSGGTAAQVVTAINSGAFILQHRDHGAENGWGEPAFTTTHINQLTNTDLTFVYSINCLTGKFNYSPECFGEKFHRHTKNGYNSGALGFVAPSEVSYSFVNDTYTWGMYDNMWPNFMPAYGSTPPSRGMLPAVGMAAGKYFLQQSNWPYNTDNKEVTYYLFHAHCDAFLQLYSEVPQNLTVQHEGVLLSGMTAYEVTANAGSFIAMTANGEILGTATGTGSPVTVTIPAQLPGTDVNLTITKENYYRYSQTIQVIPPSGPYIIKATYWVNDTILGNANGVLDYNETVNLSLGMKNVGSEQASNITVTLTTDDTYITITDAVEYFGNIEPNATLTMLNAFAFTAADNIPDNHVVTFTANSTDGTNTWESTLTVDAHAPALSVGNMTILDPTGNGNGRLDPGETAELLVPLTNTGSSLSPEALATLGSMSSYITINSGSATLGTLQPGIPVNAVFNITVDAETPVGALVDFNFAAEAGAYEAEKSFDVKIGLILEDFESGGFAQFAWTQGGNQPWTITNVEPFEGIYSAKSGTITASQKSDLSIQMEVTSADSISFYLKTSSETGYDYLKFFIDAANAGQWAGETPWTRVAFPVTAGTHTFKWEYMKDGSVSSGSDCSWIDYVVFPAAAPSAASVTGTVTYANTANTPLDGLTVKLKNSGGATVATTTTNTSGQYTFTAVPSGDYTLEVTTTKAWGGVTAADVLLYRKHIANIALLSGIYLASGDVNGSGSLTAADVLLIKKRIATITNSFTVGDWLFNNTPFTVGGGSVTQNFKGITYGDANGSYTPTGNKLQAYNPQGELRIGTVPDNEGDIVVPVMASDMNNLGSFQFTVHYDASKLTPGEATDWYSGIEGVTVGNPLPSVLTFVWAADVNGITLTDGLLCNLHFTSTASEGSALEFVNGPTVGEFGDFEGVLFDPQMVNGGVKSATGTDENNLSGFNVYPNPSDGKFVLHFGPGNGLVNIRITNALGSVVYELTGYEASAGPDKTIDLGAQPTGVYMVRVENAHQVATQKIVIGK